MQRLTYKTIGLFAAASALALGGTGCPAEEVAGDIAEQCGLECPGSAEGIVSGNASISGIRSVDAFFDAVVTFRNASVAVKAEVDDIRAKVAASVGLEADAGDAELQAAIEGKISGSVDGELEINFQPPKCEASAEVTVEASAQCDVDIDPGSAKVECTGSCTVEASAAADCDAEAEVVCTGTAPALACSGSCKGECKFAAEASCEGKCMGGCEGSCEVNIQGTCEGMCKGTCDGNTMDGGSCAGMCEGKCEIDGSAECGGSCSGECTGGCEADVSGSCSGSCEGECEYTPPMASCSAGASVTCKVETTAMAECSGKCEGEVKPPSAKAECEASADAKANASVECTKPSLDVKFAFKANVDATAQAEFRAWLEGYKANLSALFALEARAQVLVNSGGDVVAAAGGAVEGAISAMTKNGDLSLKTTFGAGCALDQLPEVEGMINGSIEDMMASVSAAGAITAGAGL